MVEDRKRRWTADYIDRCGSPQKLGTADYAGGADFHGNDFMGIVGWADILSQSWGDVETILTDLFEGGHLMGGESSVEGLDLEHGYGGWYG